MGSSYDIFRVVIRQILDRPIPTKVGLVTLALEESGAIFISFEAVGLATCGEEQVIDLCI